jgi:hypothetical protein
MLSMGTYKTVVLLRVMYIVFASLCSFVFEAWSAVEFLLIGRNNCHLFIAEPHFFENIVISINSELVFYVY